MNKKREDLKILYMQIRDDEVTKQEELDEFVRYSGLANEQFTVLNVFDTPEFGHGVMEGYDALFIGGSSDASVREPEKYSFVEPCGDLIKYCADESIPVFASCYGFQAAVEALGKKVILDKEHMEMGVYDIYLTDAVKDDLLFHDTPTTFAAVSGHKERAVELPEGAILLAYSELCPIHAFKLEGKPFYATQFHPEIDEKDLVTRITRYVDRYFDDDGELANIAKNARPTPESNLLIKKFVDRVLLGESE
jgi:GMP synthase (glutamine-hydrolysing)